jgi:hypothetical protein
MAVEGATEAAVARAVATATNIERAFPFREQLR